MAKLRAILIYHRYILCRFVLRRRLDAARESNTEEAASLGYDAVSSFQSEYVVGFLSGT
jgi:hypothetical protein